MLSECHNRKFRQIAYGISDCTIRTISVRSPEGTPVSAITFLSLLLIREIHEVLLAKGRGSHAQPGEFCKSQNWIGGSRPGNPPMCRRQSTSWIALAIWSRFSMKKRTPFHC